jgi:hypothetical protein
MIGRFIVVVGYVFTYVWLAVATGIATSCVWAAYIADPAVMAPGSLNRDSPTADKVAQIGFAVFLVAFGVVWFLLTRALRRRLKAARS